MIFKHNRKQKLAVEHREIAYQARMDLSAAKKVPGSEGLRALAEFRENIDSIITRRGDRPEDAVCFGILREYRQNALDCALQNPVMKNSLADYIRTQNMDNLVQAVGRHFAHAVISAGEKIVRGIQRPAA